MIEPNTIYIINKSNFANQASVLVKICMTLKSAKREPIDPNIFIDYVTKALATNRCVIYVSFNEKVELIACAVILLNENPVKGKIVFIEWAWTNAKFTDIGKKMFEKIEEFAKAWGAKKIAASMTRGFKAVNKIYGIKEEYRVMSKDIKEVVKND